MCPRSRCSGAVSAPEEGALGPLPAAYAHCTCVCAQVYNQRCNRHTNLWWRSLNCMSVRQRCAGVLKRADYTLCEPRCSSLRTRLHPLENRPKRPRPSTGPDEAMELSSSFRDQQSQERNMEPCLSGGRHGTQGAARRHAPSSDSDGYQRDRWRRKRTGPRRGCRMYVPWQETTMTVPSTLCCERTVTPVARTKDPNHPRRKRTVMSFAVLLPAHTRSEMGRAT